MHNIVEKLYNPNVFPRGVKYCGGNGLKISNIIDDIRSSIPELDFKTLNDIYGLTSTGNSH